MDYLRIDGPPIKPNSDESDEPDEAPRYIDWEDFIKSKFPPGFKFSEEQLASYEEDYEEEVAPSA